MSARDDECKPGISADLCPSCFAPLPTIPCRFCGHRPTIIEPIEDQVVGVDWKNRTVTIESRLVPTDEQPNPEDRHS